ncbi:hypothetical protein PHYBLDRAFT_146913 [Phycomyces blakesleeanus NRRL 1555(-)]|uniref:SWIM-type domain-containing protein n=1 Tax=Phycomyces blakesleeanus (strain ATCC 8743b / DSM 1359 / FGSC 10004 / NBRC 33097 / NRRL 1555) TaxID=763407 RepID=A0A162N7V6_PHYB8|nr:hypothetical protein PHYBLDRAFT_146913 [Phycomyces blakesleeanus NRRL 1555(-)]OAD71928.1 hypothetical protein PHYBLDRAFT_146913 [Phycomyces blakesleeanus NRRL 1555(-)]|eukprot:XP_018289968.1 hypothetical protein PHYBLDRAFT_146913 [Phycomyces blakesleeanus NRRL 1555(-)]
MTISKMQEYALVTRDSKPTRVYLKCAKDSHYKNTQNIEDSKRKRIPSTTNKIEGYYNYPLDDDCLEFILKGRSSKVTVDDAREIIKLVKIKTKTCEIQKAINEKDNVSHKLYVNDINNIKAAFAHTTASTSQDTDTELIKTMEAKGYLVRYYTSKYESLERVFFLHLKMLERAHRFSEVIAVDATYSTNNLEMTLVCMEGVYNLGKTLLNRFPLPSSEFRMRNKRPAFGSLSSSSVEKVFARKIKSVAEKDILMEYLNSMIHSSMKRDFEVMLMKFNAVSSGCEKKWAGYLTSQKMHFGCITTQRVESTHQALKREISAISSLGLAFEAVNSYVGRLERDFNTIKIRELTTVDVLVGRNKQLSRLFMKVSKRALLVIDQELCLINRDDEFCYCKNRFEFGLPCRHSLPAGRELTLDDVPER